jgi:Spy/CpxP family protein refolding chaperone
MSLALAAELNGYPGPLHTLEFAEKLSLSASQRAATQHLYERMKVSAISAGEALIAAERSLDRLFATRSVTELQLSQALSRVAEAQARLRGVHLQAHLDQVRILSPEQVAQYKRLRGYGG